MSTQNVLTNKTFIRNPYNYNSSLASAASGLVCPEPSMTQQSFVQECDINTIVRNFGLTGQLPLSLHVPTYGDFSEGTDYQSAMNNIIEAQNAFDSLPAALRNRFNNDPGLFLDFVFDESNREEAEKLGLVVNQNSIPENGAGAQAPAPD